MSPRRPIPRLDHIAIAVEDLEVAARALRALLGVEASPPQEVPSEGVRVAFFDLGGIRLELLEGTAPTSPVTRFLAGGSRGVHHIALRVPTGSLALEARRLEALGFHLAGGGPRAGSGGSSILFVHPSSTGGTLIELCERAGAARKHPSRKPTSRELAKAKRIGDKTKRPARSASKAQERRPEKPSARGSALRGRGGSRGSREASSP